MTHDFVMFLLATGLRLFSQTQELKSVGIFCLPIKCSFCDKCFKNVLFFNSLRRQKINTSWKNNFFYFQLLWKCVVWCSLYLTENISLPKVVGLLLNTPPPPPSSWSKITDLQYISLTEDSVSSWADESERSVSWLHHPKTEFYTKCQIPVFWNLGIWKEGEFIKGFFYFCSNNFQKHLLKIAMTSTSTA